MILFAFKEMHFGGGAEKNLIEVAAHVAQRHRVGFYIAGGHVDSRMTSVGPVFRMPGGGRFWAAPLDLAHLAWLVLRHRVRLMHAHHRYPAFLASLVRKLLPFGLITTVHNRFPNRAKSSVWGDRAIAVSNDIAQWLRTECGTPPSMIRVVHNGIPDPAVHSSVEIANLRATFGAHEGMTLLCAVGRLSEQKNFRLMLDALALVKAAPWRLVIVGEGELHEALEQHAAALKISDKLSFLGRRTDVPLIMQASDVLVLSSSWEGFPYVVVEALANGLPMVATDVGGVREGVIDGQTGRLVPTGDAPAMAMALDQLIADPALRRAMGQHGRQKFEASFRDAAMLEQIDAEIEGALAAHA